jgi:hypothetical protein
VKKLRLGLALVVLLIAGLGAMAAAAQAATLLSDDYEGAVKWNANSSGWSITTARAYGGAHSAYAPSANGNLMIYGPFDLSAATAARLSFQLWYYAPKASFPPGTPNTAGSFLGGYSTNGSSYTFPYQWSGSTSGEWWSTSFDLGGWSLLGQPQVWIALGTSVFAGALYSEGAYVDDLTLTATIPDTTPPTTTATGAKNGTWYKAAVTVSLAATDNAGGSGMVGGLAKTEYKVDGAVDWTAGTSVPIAAPTDHSNDLLHTILYRSTDADGNVEPDKTITVGIDTRRPVTKAPSAASVVRYRTAKLWYKVLDTGANGGKATVTIKIRNRAGRVVKTLGPYKGMAVNKLLYKTFTCRLAKGTYRFSAYAYDAAGNAQVLPVGSNRLVVK